MPSLQEISEQAAAAHEQCVREVIAIDYAYQVGKLDDWIEHKYQEVLKAAYGDSRNSPGTDPPA